MNEPNIEINESKKIEPFSLQSGKEWAEACNALLNLFYKFGILAGASIVMVYCIRLGFHPKDMSVGDALLFLFSLFSFASIEIIGLLYGAASSLWLVCMLAWVTGKFATHKFPLKDDSDRNKQSELFLSKVVVIIGEIKRLKWLLPETQKRLKASLNNGFLIVVSIFLFLLFGLTCFNIMYKKEITHPIAIFMLGFWVAGFILLLATALESAPTKNESNEQSASEKRWLPRLYFLAAIFCIPLVIGSPGYMLEMSMQLIGLRVENMPVQVSEENFSKITEIADRIGIPVLDCKISNTKEHIVYGLDVLWHGVGSVAYVRIKSTNKNQNHSAPYAEFELEDKGVSPITTNNNLSPCFELKADALFDSHQWKIKDENSPALTQLRQQLNNLGEIESVKIIGHTDPIPALNPDNQKLSNYRAEAIKEWMLKQSLKLKENEIHTEGIGSSRPLVICAKSNDSQECNSSNRRVEIIVRVKDFQNTP